MRKYRSTRRRAFGTLTVTDRPSSIRIRPSPIMRFVTGRPVRSSQLISAAVVSAFCCCGWFAHAAVAAIPVCKPFQVSTKSQPCYSAQAQDPGDTGTRSNQTDAVTVFRFLDPSIGKYQIEIENTSGIGFINTFTWNPPPGMTITAVTSTEGAIAARWCSHLVSAAEGLLRRSARVRWEA